MAPDTTAEVVRTPQLEGNRMDSPIGVPAGRALSEIRAIDLQDDKFRLVLRVVLHKHGARFR